MKVLYVTTVSGTMNFFVDHIRMLLEAGHSVDLACNWSRPQIRCSLNGGVSSST